MVTARSSWPSQVRVIVGLADMPVGAAERRSISSHRFSRITDTSGSSLSTPFRHRVYQVVAAGIVGVRGAQLEDVGQSGDSAALDRADGHRQAGWAGR